MDILFYKEYTLETTLLCLLQGSGKNVRVAKIIEMSQAEYTRFSNEGEEEKIYIYWCFIDSCTFVFGEIKICRDSIFCLCKQYDFIEWAKKAYTKDWFSRRDVRYKKLGTNIFTIVL